MSRVACPNCNGLGSVVEGNRCTAKVPHGDNIGTRCDLKPGHRCWHLARTRDGAVEWPEPKSRPARCASTRDPRIAFAPYWRAGVPKRVRCVLTAKHRGNHRADLELPADHPCHASGIHSVAWGDR